MPSYFEYASLALDVYRDKNRPPLLAGWEIYADYVPTTGDLGYFGTCYIQKFGNELMYVVFAHRGTVLSSSDNLIADIAIALGNVPIQYASAKNFYEQTVARLKKDFPRDKDTLIYQTIHTGHSLGAIIAEIMCAAGFNSPLILFNEVSFESPGSKPIIETMMKAKTIPDNALVVANQNCLIIQTHYNVINTCNEQITDDIQFASIPYNYDVAGGPITIIPDKYYLNYYYILGYSFLDQHSIKNIYDFFSNQENTGYPITDWPYGFQQGYEYYKYGPYKYPNYWDQYIQRCWDTHPEIQFAYQGNYAKYCEYFYEEYLSDKQLNKKADKSNKLLVENSIFKISQENFVLVESESSDHKTDAENAEKNRSCNIM